MRSLYKFWLVICFISYGLAPPVLRTHQGGTGLDTYAAGDLVYWASGTTYTRLAITPVNTILRSTGTAPAWTTTILETTTGNIVTLDGTGAFTGARSVNAGWTFNSPAAGTVGLIVNTAASPTASAQEWRINGTRGAIVDIFGTITRFLLDSRDLGNNTAGGMVQIGRNTNAGAEGPTASTVRLIRADGTTTMVWVDNTAGIGILRINDTAPTGSSGTPTTSDTAGTVVGSQTSWWALKENIRLAIDSDYQSALQVVLQTPLSWFNLIEDHEKKQKFGYVIYDEDRGSWFSYNDITKGAVPALDERNIFGYHAGAIKSLYAKFLNLEKRLESLEPTVN